MPVASPMEARFAAVSGWSLLQFLWQGCLAGLVLATALRALRRAPATTRYALCCGALAALVLCPLLTFLQFELTTGHLAMAVIPQVRSAATRGSVLSDPGRAAYHGFEEFVRTIEPWIPAILGFWLVGALIGAGRILAGLIGSRRLRAASCTSVAAPLCELAGQLAGALGISRNVDLLVSTDTSMPAVMGWRRPAILLPPSAMQHLSAEEMESILAHELAHIRRYDYPVNVAQAVVEALLFYHPVVWWVSRQIRREREHCCDDIAIRISGAPLVCAKALTALEERRTSAIPVLSPAASRGDLTMRIRRLLTPEPTKPLRPWMAVSLASLGLASVALLTVLSLSAADTMSPLMAEVVGPNPGAASSKQTKSQRPDMACTYYKYIPGPPERDEPHPGSCVDTGSDTGTFFCHQTDEDKKEQNQSACQWKVQRLHQWQALQSGGK